MDDMFAGLVAGRRGNSAASILDALAADACRAVADRQLQDAEEIARPPTRNSARTAGARRADTGERNVAAFVAQSLRFLRDRPDGLRILNEIASRLGGSDADATRTDDRSERFKVSPRAPDELEGFDPLDDLSTPAGASEAAGTIDGAEAWPSSEPETIEPRAVPPDHPTRSGPKAEPSAHPSSRPPSTPA